MPRRSRRPLLRSARLRKSSAARAASAKTVWEGNPLVIDILKEHGALLGLEDIDHSYPHCWRCHNATIFRATDQWFIGMDNNGLRARALDAIKGVQWIPAWGEERISNMVSGRPDWCISRQRVWGVPIVVFYCAQCREPLTDRKILDAVVDLFAQHSADIWFERTAAELVPAGTACAKCGATEFTKENDILDVWFDSGSSHLAVLNEENGLRWPAELYMEGGDQYRGWFQSSLLIGVGLRGGSPYRACATHGWTLDGDGRPLSKSLGNGVAPEEIISDYGAEIIRLWTASVDFMEDVRISPEILTRLSDAYRKLRNTFRYALGNLHDFNPATDAVPGDQLFGLDQWILVRAEDVVARCRIWYDEFAFHKVYRAVYDFATVDLSSIYFDVLKDRLYTSAPKSHARRSAQTALHRLALALVRLLRAHPQLHDGRNLGPSQSAGQRPHGVFPRVRGSYRRHRRRRPRPRGKLGPADGGSRHRQQEPRNRSPGENHRRPPRSPRTSRR